ncbi:MAG: matrixin family metalloprotease [Deltaproteobacteria bacterium]|nr:matrixin family metalloprotease [Deltaproteobacteria bacterium]
MTPSPFMALAALLAAGTAQASAYERAPAGEGLCQYWPDPGTPKVRRVAYEVSDPGAAQACRSGGDPVLAIRNAFAGWAAAARPDESVPCTDMQLVFDGVGACADLYDCWDHDRFIALTTTTYRLSTGVILDADVEVNAGDGEGEEGFLLTCIDPPAPVCTEERRIGCIGMDLQNAISHEVGHFLGFAHSDSRGSTMYAKASRGETGKRVLSADAVEGMCDVYPRGGAVTTCGTRPQGCSTIGAPDSWLGLAALALLLRRRARQETTTPA